ASTESSSQEESANLENSDQEESASTESSSQEESASTEGSSQEESANLENSDQKESASTESSSQEESASTESSSQEESSSQIVIEELTLNKSKLELEKGEEETLIVTILPEDYKGSKNVEWKSSNEEVVKVEVIKEKLPEESKEEKPEVEMAGEESTQESEEELQEITVKAIIKAVGGGEAAVTASLNGKETVCNVNVISLVKDITFESKNINDNELTVYDNSEKQELIVNIEPSDATNKEFSVEIKDEELLGYEIVDNKILFFSKGILGKTEVLVKASDIEKLICVNIEDENRNDKSDIIPVDELRIDAVYGKKETEVKDAVNLVIGSGTAADATANIGLSIAPLNVTEKEIVWESSDSSIVSVIPNTDIQESKNGKWLKLSNAATIKAQSLGTTIITAKATNGVVANVKVVVSAANKGNGYLVLDKTKIVLYSNEKLPEDNKIQSKGKIIPFGTGSYSYCSSNTTIATVDDNGDVIAHNPGTAVVTVTDKINGSKGVVTIIVKKIAEDINIPVDKITLIEGTTTEIPFSILPKDISKESLNTLNVVYSDEAPVKVRITEGNKKGVIEITAKHPSIQSNVDAVLTIQIGDKNTYTQVINNNVVPYTDDVVSIEKKIEIDIISKKELVKSITLTANGKSDKKIKLKSGEGISTKVVLKDASGNLLDESIRTVAYISSNDEIVTVDKSGYINAKKGGEAVITAKVLDGSNISAALNITVEQKPEKIYFDREVYGLNKKSNSSASVTLSPLFYPDNTASSCKGVEWEIIEAGSEKTTDSSDYVRSLFSINNKGKVTVNKYAVDGMYVKIRCKSKENSAIEGTVTVKAQTQKVSAVKFKKATNEFVGLGKHNIDFTTTYVKNYSGIPEYSAYSSDDEIVTVNGIKNGYLIIDAHKFGQATITLFVDNTKKATCKVIIDPDAKGEITAQKTNYYLQTYQNAPNDSVKLSFINSKTKKEIDPSLLKYTLTYADPKYSLAYIDDKGYVHANPANNEEITDKNCDITVTAELKDDPLKRKATTKVTFCTVKQIDRFDVMFYDNAKDMEVPGIYINDNDERASIKYDGESQTIGLRIIPYDATSAVKSDTDLGLTISDSTIAEFAGKPIRTKVGSITGWNVEIKIK
ncbi:MAG: Ig-like domain-containing protein, partial [Lachnospiraceae bacterium]|nr:Ig-like domain-containing protein [Lachnospiraceae bacterium]